jgi:plasmid stabilization system protein ParE
MTIVWTAPALREIEAIGDYIALESPRASARIVTRVFDRVDTLADHPEIGRPGRIPGTRELVITTRHSSFPIACAVTELKCCLCSMGLAAGPIVFDL